MDFDETKKKYEPSKEKKIIYRKYGRKFILTSSPFVALFIGSMTISNVYATGLDEQGLNSTGTDFTNLNVENVLALNGTTTSDSYDFLIPPAGMSPRATNVYNRLIKPRLEDAVLVSNEEGVIEKINWLLEVRAADQLDTRGTVTAAGNELEALVTEKTNERRSAVVRANSALDTDFREFPGFQATYHNYLDESYERLRTAITAASRTPTVTTAELIGYAADFEQRNQDIMNEIMEYGTGGGPLSDQWVAKANVTYIYVDTFGR